MAKGRKALPTAIKELRGGSKTYHRKGNDQEPKVPGYKIAPRPPKHLDDVAKTEWRRIAPMLCDAGVMTKVDRSGLEAYCVAYATWVHATEQIQKHGMLIKSPNGYPTQSPYLSIADRAAKEYRAWLVEFGMTPSSRSKVKAAGEKEEKDPLAEFMAKGGRPYAVGGGKKKGEK